MSENIEGAIQRVLENVLDRRMKSWSADIVSAVVSTVREDLGRGD